MPGFFTCRHCGKTLSRTPQSKKQKYCSSKVCQNARKRIHEGNRDRTAAGKLLKKGRNKRWRDKAPAHTYQDKYRKSHPAYKESNREQQKLRKKRHQESPGPKIVKTDALLLQPLYDGAYKAFKVKSQKIVKTDTLMLQMQSQKGIDAYFM